MSKDVHGNELKEQPELITPETIAGMLTKERWEWLRKKGITVNEIAALSIMHHRGQYPGQRLFTSKSKSHILDKRYKKLRLKTEKEVRKKYQSMRAEWIQELKHTKAKLEAEGVDFEAVNKEAGERNKKIIEVVKEQIEKEKHTKNDKQSSE